MGISPKHHRNKWGSELLKYVEKRLLLKGVVVLQVKTLSARSDNSDYAKTRLFYESQGFLELDEFPLLWSERDPAVQYVKILG